MDVGGSPKEEDYIEVIKEEEDEDQYSEDEEECGLGAVRLQV